MEGAVQYIDLQPFEDFIFNVLKLKDGIRRIVL
jgi:hypothetical protein